MSDFVIHGERACQIAGNHKIKSHRHIATDERMDFERRKDLFELVTPAERREIAIRYQLDHTLGVAHAKHWAALRLAARGTNFWGRRSRWMVSASTRN